MVRTDYSRSIPLITLALLTGIVLAGCTSAARYRCFHSERALFAVMHTQIQNGDSYETVSKLLGPAVPAKEQTYIATKKLAAKYPGKYPDGLRETDTVMSFPGGLNLEFRDGKLINHDPAAFAEYKETVLIKAP